MRRRKCTRLALGLASFFCGGAAAYAGVGTSSFTAQATVNTNCTILTTPVAFGGYDPIGAHRSADLNATGAITVACVKGTAPTIALGLGSNASGSARRMRDVPSGDFLGYELYQPPSNTPATPCSFPGATVWGTAGANLFSATSAPDKNARTYNVCGSVAAGQNPSIGTYSDTVVATVNF
jgi:spore coat protein U domain-containing protein, fimbrial subunit CupE1/2/3/6